MIPLMTSEAVGLRLSQHAAHGTSLFAVAATGLAGALSYGADVVQVPEACAIALTAVVTARWGAQATLQLSGRSLKRLLGMLMLAMAPLVPAKAYYLRQRDEQQRQRKQQRQDQQEHPGVLLDAKDESSPSSSSDNNKKEDAWTYYVRQHLLAPALIGVGSGYLAGLFGVGGGTIVVPALAVATDLTHHQALATSLAAMIVPAVSGTVTHYRAGNCALAVAPVLAGGALVGAAAGAQLALHTNETWLRWGFSGLLAALGVRTLVKA